VVAAHGKPQSLKHLNYGGKPFDLASYAVKGGKIEVYYDRKTHGVVGLATTSPAFRAADGLGVGAPASKAAANGFSWNAQCTTTYLKTKGGIYYEVFTRGHSRAGAISEVYFIRAEYAGEC